MLRRILCRWVLPSVWLASCAMVQAASPTDYAPVDAELRVDVLDSSPDESFLSLRADGQGTLFVGGREAVFRYDVNEQGTYASRRELLRFPAHSWVYDLELRGPDLYVLTMNALYVVPGGAVQTEGLKPKRLLWGVPAGHVHQCFHGLAWGPEGDLYISMGDPLWYYGDFDRPDHWGYWTFFTADDASPKGWKPHAYHGVGAVFRLRADGTRFQTVATGLRNSCGLVFDSNFNLFTNDNDHEGLPHAYVPGRLNHVVPQAYFSWPRGWLPHLTPERADLLDTMTTKLGRVVPVGQSYYDDDFLGASYRNNLLVARWCTRAVTRYPLQPAGATFHCDEHPLIVGKDLARPVGVTVGRGGRVFVTISYMANNEGSPIYRSDLAVLTRQDDASNYPFDAIDVLHVPTERLLSELIRCSDWSRRRLILVELQRRSPHTVDAVLKQLAMDRLPATARGDLLWLAAAALADSDFQKLPPGFRRQLLNELNRGEDVVALQAWRITGEFWDGDAELQTLIERRLTELSQVIAGEPKAVAPRADDHAVTREQLQHAALLSLMRRKNSLPEVVTDVFARSSDRYLRQSATRLMAERLSAPGLRSRANTDDPKGRLAIVLASGFRLTLPKIDQVLDENLPLTPWRNPDEAYRIQYADETEPTDLQKFGRVGTYTVAEHWKAARHSTDQEQLFDLLVHLLDDPAEPVRLQAAHFLSLLNDPRSEPKVQQVLRKNEQARLQLADLVNPERAWVAGPFPDAGKGFAVSHGPEQGPIDLATPFSVADRTIAWQPRSRGPRFFDFHEMFGAVDDTSSYAFFRLESPRKQQAMLLVGSDDGIRVWHNGRLVHSNDISRAALPLQDIVYLDLDPGSNDLLFRVRNVSGESGLYIHYRTIDKIPPVLPEPISAESLTERLRNAATSGNTPVDPAFLSINWSEAAKQGDAARGQKLFSAEGLGCAKCHSIHADQPVVGGPSLAAAAQRFTLPHLVESVLAPSRMVSPVFKATLVTTKDGKQLSGLVLGETGEKLELLLPDAKRVTLMKAEIDESKLQDLSPMPSGLVKQPDELRDLLAYLLSASSS